MVNEYSKKRRSSSNEDTTSVNEYSRDVHTKKSAAEIGSYVAFKGLTGATNMVERAANILNGDSYYEQTAGERYEQQIADTLKPSKALSFAGDIASGIGQQAPYLLNLSGLPIGTVVAAAGHVGGGIAEGVQTTGNLGGREVAYGLITGSEDTLLDLAMGGGAKAINKLAPQAVKTAGKAAAEGFGKSVGKELIKSFAGEASQEFIEDFTDTGLQKWLLQDDTAQFDLKRALYSAAVGGFSGAAVGGAASAIGYKVNSNRGRQIYNAGEADTSVATAKAVLNALNGQQTGIKNDLARIKGMENGLGKVIERINNFKDNRRVSQLIEAIEGDIQAWDALTNDQRNTEAGHQILGELSANYTAMQMSSFVAEVEERIKSAPDADIQSAVNQINEEQGTTYTVQDVRENKDGIATELAGRVISDLYTGENTVCGYDQQADVLEKINSSFAGSDDASATFADYANAVSLSDFERSQMEHEWSDTYGLSPTDYAIGYATASRMGKYGVDMDTMRDESVQKLPETLRKAAYAAGALQRGETIASKAKAVVKRQNDTRTYTKGNVSMPSNLKESDMDEQQKATVTAARILSSAMDVKIRLVNSVERDGRYYITENGKERDISSWYGETAADGTITVDLNSISRGNNVSMYVLAHEVTHDLRKMASAQFEKLSDIVAERYALAWIDFDQLVKDRLNNLEAKRDSKFKAMSYDEKYDYAREEVICDSMQTILNDGEALRMIYEQDKTLFQKIKDFITKMIAKIRAAYDGISGYTGEARLFANIEGDMKEIEAAFAEAVKAAGQNTATVEGTDSKYSFSSIAYSFFGDEDITPADFENGRYKQTDGYKTYVNECVDIFTKTHNGVSEREARAEIVSSIDGIVRVAVAAKKAGYDIFDDKQRRDTRDSKGRLLFSSLEPNSDYFTSSDISTICDKRMNFAQIYDEIVRREEKMKVPANKRFFSNVDNYFVIHKIMADKGLTTPCRQCYVESMRKNLAPMENAFLRLVQETDAGNKKNDQLYNRNGDIKSNNYKLREAVIETLAEHPEYNLSVEDLDIKTLTTADGLAQLKIQAPLIYEAFNSFYGQSKPKMPKQATPFRFGELHSLLINEKGEIKKSLVNKINSAGGFRLQSYSDFQNVNYVDVLQVLFEAGTLGLTGHAYTKVPAFLSATEGTNLKRNISVFMYQDGSGWKLDIGDSFPVRDIEAAESVANADKSGNTGIIAVSQNEVMSAYIMANDGIDYGIPFHKSGMKMGTVRQTEVKTANGTVLGYKNIKDHTKQQTEVWKTTTADHKANTKVKDAVNIYDFWDMDNEDGLSKNELIEKNVKRYIDECESRGYLPKFRELVMDNQKVLNNVLMYAKQLGYVTEDATADDISFDYKGYTIPYGYYKFLVDFRVFKEDGTASPHEILSLKNYDFDKAVQFFGDSEERRRKEALQQFTNGEEREKYRNSDLTADQLYSVIEAKRKAVAEEVTSGGETGVSMFSDRVTEGYDLKLKNGETVDAYDYLNGLKESEVEYTYKSMSFWGYDDDGNAILRSPMAEIQGGKLSTPYLIPANGKKPIWYMATESFAKDGKQYPDDLLVKIGKTFKQANKFPDHVKDDWSNLYYNLVKVDEVTGEKKKVPARYNPYEHSSNLVLNDQFSTAYKRPKLVTVKMMVPKSEQGAYRAKYSKDGTGWTEWKSGVVAGEIADQKDGFSRSVFLSRFAAPVEIVPNSEVAKAYKKYIDGTTVSVPWNVVTPELRHELEKIGVPISYEPRTFGSTTVTFNGSFPDEANKASKFSDRDSDGNTLSKTQQEYFKDSKARDANGNLLVVYHGTPKGGFNEFDKKRVGTTSDYGYFGRGFYFTTKQSVAKYYAGYLNSSEIKRGYLNMTNPFVIGSKRDLKRSIEDIMGMRFEGENADYERSSAFTDWLIDNGYDGVICKDEYMIFESNQFKNDDNTNPTGISDIRYSDRDKDLKKLMNSTKPEYFYEMQDAMKAYYEGKLAKAAFEKKQAAIEAKMKLTDERNRRAYELWRLKRIDRMKLQETKARDEELLKETREKYREKIKQTRQDNLDRLDQLREDYKQRMADMREQFAESRAKDVEGRRRTELKDKISKKMNDISKLLLHPTKDSHVPSALRSVVAESLNALDASRVDYEKRLANKQAEIDKELAKAEPNQKKLETLRRQLANIEATSVSVRDQLTALSAAYSKIKESDNGEVRNIYSEFIHSRIRSLIDEIGTTPMGDLNSRQLKDVYDTYKAILKTINDANKMFRATKYAKVSEAAMQMAEDVRANGRKTGKSISSLEGLKGFVWRNMKPYTFMKTIGGDVAMELFDGLRQGERTWAFDVRDAKRFFDGVADKYDYDKWDFDKEYTFDTMNGKVTMKLGHIMTMYAYSQDEQSVGHLTVGGFALPSNFETTEKVFGKIPVKKRTEDVTPKPVGIDQLETITNTLTAEQKDFIGDMVKYLSETMGAKGNEVSRAMYDFDMFTSKWYFPIKSVNEYLKQDTPEEVGSPMLKNKGFTQERVAGASNPIVVGDFMDMWGSHVSEMAMFHGFVLPVEDFSKVWGYRWKDEMGDLTINNSIRNEIKRAYGQTANEYIDTLLKDLNGGVRMQPGSDLISKGLSLFKKGATFASASVVIQQPTAIIRAMAVIDPKYFADSEALDFKKHGELWEEIIENTGAGIIKDMGFFDVGVGTATSSWIKKRQYNGFKEKIAALAKDSDYRDEILSKGASMADELAWTHLWLACKNEAADKLGKPVDSKEVIDAAAKRFEEVTNQTQVYDSILTRSEYMRSKDTGAKMATAFMAEPTTSVNMLFDAIVNKGIRGKDPKDAARQIGAVAGSLIASSALVSLVYAARNADKDKTYPEKYVESFLGELAENFNPMSMIPIARDILSLMEGYDVNRADMTVYANVINAVRGLSSKTKTPYRKAEDFAGSIAGIFGLPVKNIMRDLRSVGNVATDAFMSAEKTTNAGLGYAALEGLFGKEYSNQEQLYRAIMSGDKAQYKRVASRYADESTLETALRSVLRQHDERITRAAEAKIDGDMNAFNTIVNTIAAEGKFDKDLIIRAVNSEVNFIKRTA